MALKLYNSPEEAFAAIRPKPSVPEVSFNYNKEAFGNNIDFLNWYEGILNQKGLSSDNRQMLLNNPYLTQSIQKKGFFDTVSENFIGTSNYQKSIQDLEAQARAYAAQYMDIQRQENYNSPLSQAERQLQSGVPVSGDNIDSGQTADFDQQATEASAPTPTGSEAAMPLLNAPSQIFGWLGGILSLSKQMQDLSMYNVDLSSKELDVDSKAFSLASDIVPKTFTKLNFQDSIKRWAKQNFKYEDFNGSLDELIEKVNKDNPKDLQYSPEDFYQWYVIDAAKKVDTSYLGRHARRAMNKYLTQLSPDSPFVRQQVQQFLTSETQNKASQKVAMTLIQTYSEEYMKLSSSVEKIGMEAQKEYQDFQRKMWEKMNNYSQPNADGETDLSLVDAQVQAEYEAAIAQKQQAITQKMQQKIQQEVQDAKSAVMRKINPKEGEHNNGLSAWDTFKTVMAGSLPAALELLEGGAQQAIGTWTSRIFSAPAPPPAPRVTNVTNNTTNTGDTLIKSYH